VQEDGILRRSSVSRHSELHIDPGSPKLLGSARRYRIWVAERGDHPANAGPNDRLGARRLLALMRTGLEGDDHRRPSSPLACCRKRYRLGMPLAEFGVPTFTDNLITP
jgi:hypothetical protein